MLTFPKYQPIWFNKPPICGKCDIVTIGDNKDFSFVYNRSLVHTPNLFINSEFNNNPFMPITSTDLVFDINTILNDQEYWTLYIESKIYIIKTAINPTAIQVIGNITIIPYYTLMQTANAQLLIDFNNFVDTSHGTTTGLSGNTFTIADIPANSYLDDTAFNLLTNINTVGAQIESFSLINGYYDEVTNKIKYLLVYNYDSGFMRITFNKILDALKTFNLKYLYKTTNGFNYEITIIDNVTASTILDTTTLNLPLTSTEKEIKYNITTVGNNEYTFIFLFTPENADINTYLTVDNISLNKVEYCDISEVKLIADNGLDFTLTLESSPYLTLTPINDISVLFNLEISEILTLLEDADYDWRKNCIRFQIKDCDNNVYYSNYFNFHDSNTPACLDTKTRITWYNKCSFNGIDYSNGNMFEIYVKGFPRRLSIDKSDRNVFISSEGKHSLAYDFSYVRYELKVVGYTEILHEVIEKAVLHSHFYINGERYMIDSDSKYEFGRNINARMTATIELIKDGTELLILDCCN